MKVKIFQEIGESGIQQLEDMINNWLANQPGPIEIQNIQMCAAGGIGDILERSGYQHTVVISVWYESIG